MAQHVGMDPEPETGGLAGSGNELLKPSNGERRVALGDEHEGRGLALALQPAQRPQLASADRMGRGSSLLAPVNVQAGSVELNLLPAQIDKLRRAQAVPEGSQDHGCIAMAVPVRLGRRQEPLDLRLGQMLTGSVCAIGEAPRTNCP